LLSNQRNGVIEVMGDVLVGLGVEMPGAQAEALAASKSSRLRCAKVCRAPWEVEIPIVSGASVGKRSVCFSHRTFRFGRCRQSKFKFLEPLFQGCLLRVSPRP
jgi:hypothetical protein